MTDLADTDVSFEPAAPVRVRPLSGHIGAEIDGIDLARPLSDTERTVVQDALDRWKVVFFRGQDIGHREQIEFARQFGDLTYAHPYDNDPPDGFPEIYTVSPERFAQQYGITGDAAKELRRRYSYSNDWHTDVTAAINPPAASVLRADEVPEFGGDTGFTNLVAAYEGLSTPLREFVETLRAEHRYGASQARNGVMTMSNDVIGTNRLISRHPVVRVHPRTGERALFVNPGFTYRIVGVSPSESKHLLDLLFEQITRATYTVRFRWEPGSVAFWDNRVTAHIGPQDIDHLDVRRVLHRVTLIGEVPVGVDGRESESVEGTPFIGLPASS